MAKKIEGYLKLQVPAGAANPSPPIGPALGQRGINIMEFCKAFNAKTENMEKGAPIPTVVTYYQDKSFTFVTKKPPATYYILKEAGLKKGSQTPGKAVAAKLSAAQVRKIAEEKMSDLNAESIEAAERIIKGSATSMGIEVEG